MQKAFFMPEMEVEIFFGVNFVTFSVKLSLLIM